MISIIPTDATQVAFKQEMTLNNVVLNLHFYFNQRSSRWKLDVYDANEEPLILGRTINLGLDLLNRFVLEELPRALLSTINLKNTTEEANFTNFGKDVLLIFDDEVVEVEE
jgi:hypothetical protein